MTTLLFQNCRISDSCACFQLPVIYLECYVGGIRVLPLLMQSVIWDTMCNVKSFPVKKSLVGTPKMCPQVPECSLIWIVVAATDWGTGSYCVARGGSECGISSVACQSIATTLAIYSRIVSNSCNAVFYTVKLKHNWLFHVQITQSLDTVLAVFHFISHSFSQSIHKMADTEQMLLNRGSNNSSNVKWCSLQFMFMQSMFCNLAATKSSPGVH